MLINFLSGVDIAHDHGHYETVGSAEPPSTETLEKTVGQLLENDNVRGPRKKVPPH